MFDPSQRVWMIASNIEAVLKSGDNPHLLLRSQSGDYACGMSKLVLQTSMTSTKH
jgi:hypothetical protein